jgi:FkbM family methyltransferase
MSNLIDRFKVMARADEDILETITRDMYTEFLAHEPPYSAIDGGAHRGLHTFPLSRLPNCAVVYAVEANQDLARELAQQDWFNTTGARTVVVAAAIQHDPARETVTFMLSDSHAGRSGISSIFKDDKEVTFSNITVPATTIDKLAADRKHPVKFVKLDLEGGEWNAVRGAADVMANDRPVFVMEHSIYSPEINGYTQAEYLALFDQRGYQLITFAGEPMDEQNMFYLWYVWAAPKEKAAEIQAMLRRNAEKRTPAAG